MSTAHPNRNTQTLSDAARGDRAASAELLAQVYDELRNLAAALLRRERGDHTLQPTALVHEAYLKLIGGASIDWQNQAHFRAVAASAMRQILTDHARRRNSEKRGGGWLRVTLDEPVAPMENREVDMIALDEALSELSRLDERKSRVVELRFFGGLTCAEAAETLAVSPKTAESDWYMARAWLRQRLAEAG
jgi:RNA polymerase sigma factor (TIGR02999 family)